MDSIENLLGQSESPVKFHLIGLMLTYWNYILISGCGIIIVYHFVHGLYKTSEHGQFMGREAEKGGTILRLVFGPFIMVPCISKAGFCVAQYVIMALILYGVHAANVLWADTTNGIKMSYSRYSTWYKNANVGNCCPNV